MVSISIWLVCESVSISTMPRSASRATPVVAVLSFSAFLRKSSLVISETARCASSADCVWCMPSASTIWLFHSGMVFTIDVWIFSAISWFED